MNTAPHRSFADLFFARSLQQQFNDTGTNFESDENEPAVLKYLKAVEWAAATTH